ncbi:DUF4089 domain-containing protein [Methylovirgula ligni]|uniref:Uncharacterized protein DUF4089 n=1 Tax=Methylovirgula ligni TaxID=569860 RepID=A0A3D9Z4I1_9HYPH|nr:DUF4089 domain-containing protein [Methylovirgula ligni]QAY95531.1 DUF4089 domain-containing protein [Methylovirgula ligni]REF89130.1 uncharacterized protein DUF4089 [Methylovirgula ligni]
MTVLDGHLAAWCDALAALLELPIERGDRAEIVANLRLIARQIELVFEVALDDLAEPAPVFRA